MGADQLLCSFLRAGPSESCSPSQIHMPRAELARALQPLSPRSFFMPALYARIAIGIDPLSGSRLSFRAQIYAESSRRR
jgi:hypothetical protein